jgi:hypothetical protein
MDTRKALIELTGALRDLHRALVQVQRHKYEKEWESVDPGTLLQLLTRHPEFDWLHVLSEFMAGVDTMVDDREVTLEDVRAIYKQASDMLTPGAENPTAFSDHYLAALQDNPSAVIALAAVRRVLGAS